VQGILTLRRDLRAGRRPGVGDLAVLSLMLLADAVLVYVMAF